MFLCLGLPTSPDRHTLTALLLIPTKARPSVSRHVNHMHALPLLISQQVELLYPETSNNRAHNRHHRARSADNVMSVITIKSVN